MVISNKEKGLQARWGTGATTRRKWHRNLGRRNEKLWSEYVSDRFEPNEKNGGSV